MSAPYTLKIQEFRDVQKPPRKKIGMIDDERHID